jgi:hypothetical protein
MEDLKFVSENTNSVVQKKILLKGISP